MTDFFADRLKKELGVDAYAPYSGWEFDLLADRFLAKPEGIRISVPSVDAVTRHKKNSVFERLVAAGQRLMTVIRHNEGGANKDLAKFTDQINSLCDKWDR